MKQELQTEFDTVMIIDDNTIDLYVSARIMKKNNFGKNILEFSYAQDALQYLLDHQENFALLPQVILVDIYMPMMSGFEFMAEYDKLPEAFRENCYVFIVSSSIDETDIHRARKDNNIVAFQEKPVTKEFLQQIKAA